MQGFVEIISGQSNRKLIGSRELNDAELSELLVLRARSNRVVILTVSQRA